jgi:hypothetical protein
LKRFIHLKTKIKEQNTRQKPSIGWNEDDKVVAQTDSNDSNNRIFVYKNKISEHSAKISMKIAVAIQQ